MSFALIVYLIGMLDPLKNTAIFFFVVGFTACIILTVVVMIAEDEINSASRRGYTATATGEYLRISLKFLKISGVACISSLILSIVVPSKETAYVMIAASGVEAIVSDERVQQLGGKGLDVIEKWLDEIAPESTQGGGE